MEIRASTIIFAKRKAKQRRNEEKELLVKFTRLQKTNYEQTSAKLPKLKWIGYKKKKSLRRYLQIKLEAQLSEAKLNGTNLV